MSDKTSKARRSRIELDYYRKPDRIGRWRGRLAVGLGLAALGWVLAAPVVNRGGTVRLFQTARLASPGPLHASHALWEERCETCHEPFETIRALGGRQAAGGGQDARCRACHGVGGHHADASVDEGTCGSCHIDHQGRAGLLTAVEDVSCTRCHAGLDGHRKGGTGVAQAVRGFAGSGHPEFSWVGGTEPGRVAFNHARHLARGMAAGPGQAAFGFGRLAEGDRSRYGWKPGVGLDAPVQLECGSCHQMADRITAEAERGSMVRVTYEGECRACHPLAYAAGVAPARHGVQPAEVVAEVRRALSLGVLAEDPAILERPLSRRVLPGRKADDGATAAARAVVEERVVQAGRILFGNGGSGGVCRVCHVIEGEGMKRIAVAGRVDEQGSGSGSHPRLEGLAAPSEPRAHGRGREVGMRRGTVFDHEAHQGVGCLGCHAGAAASTRAADVLRPGKAVCASCHRPEGAPDGCAVCHRYHVDAGIAIEGRAIGAFVNGR